MIASVLSVLLDGDKIFGVRVKSPEGRIAIPLQHLMGVRKEMLFGFRREIFNPPSCFAMKDLSSTSLDYRLMVEGVRKYLLERAAFHERDKLVSIVVDWFRKGFGEPKSSHGPYGGVFHYIDKSFDLVPCKDGGFPYWTVYVDFGSAYIPDALFDLRKMLKKARCLMHNVKYEYPEYTSVNGLVGFFFE